MTFERSYRFRFGDIDHAGIAYYPSLLHYVHCTFEDWWADELGTPYPEVLNGERIGFPAVHIDADFVAPIRYGDEPAISVAVLGVGRSSVTFGFRFRLADRTCCRVRVTAVCVDMDSLAKRPIPEHWRRAFEVRRVSEQEAGGG